MKTEVRSTLIAPKGICLMHEFSSAVHKATKKTQNQQERDEGRVEGAVKVDGGRAETGLRLRETK